MSAPRQIRPRRSFIFTPGLNPAMYPKALASGTDIVCVELEDGVAPKDKDAARANAMALFAEPQADDGVERIVRINCVREAFGLADVQAVLATDTPPPALMMPKVRTPDEVIWLDDLLTERGHPTRLHIIIETNPGLEAVMDIIVVFFSIHKCTVLQSNVLLFLHFGVQCSNGNAITHCFD